MFVTAAIAVANLYLLVRLWSGRNFPALIATVTLAVSHTFWRHASIAETYTLIMVWMLAANATDPPIWRNATINPMILDAFILFSNQC